MSARIDCNCVTFVAKVSNNLNLKRLNPKQTLQRIPIKLVLVKPGSISKNLLNQIRQIIYSSYRAKSVQHNEFNKVIKQNLYYIYEF